MLWNKLDLVISSRFDLQLYLCRFFFLLGPNYIMGTHNMYILLLYHKYFQQLVSFAGGLVINTLHCELKDPRLLWGAICKNIQKILIFIIYHDI